MRDSIYLSYLLLWVAVGSLAYFSVGSERWRGAGLSLAFFVNMALNHWFGALVCFFPWYTPAAGVSTVERGFEMSTVGIVAYAIGCFGIAPLLTAARPPVEAPGAALSPRIIKAFFAVGIGCYLGMVVGVGRIASMTAVLSTGFNFVLVAICLGLWDAAARGNGRRFCGLLAATLLLPAFTMVTQGFLGYGVDYVILIFSFLLALYRHRLRMLLAILPLAFLALSFYVTYMRDRQEIRAVVWGGRDYGMRIKRVLETCETIEWFDPWDLTHLRRIDGRLNHNWLVGAAIQRLSYTRDYGHGETIGMAVLALIPRAIWPDKTVVAGSMGLVSKYTGIAFAEGVSVGMGLVFEFYVNFGGYGVFVGLLLMGILVGVADRKAGAALRTGLVFDFAMWFLIGIAAVNVLGSLVEITPGLMAAVVFTAGLKAVLKRAPAPEIYEPLSERTVNNP